ncbi:MAG: flagellar M-ring protein FliF [Spirochaetales bacterium]|nr:flagellar M-ring protein FliF [Spirochaetales bacterium]
MNEWLRQLLNQIKTLWGKWSLTQKIILLSIVGVAVLAVILIVVFSSAPTMVTLIGAKITDENNLARIVTVLDEEGVTYKVSPENMIYVEDAPTARRIRAILIREDLIPPKTDPWAIFDVERWTLTDFERDVNLQRAITRNLEQHILALDDVDAASVTLVVPRHELFEEDQNPVTASVIITPKPGSDIMENRKKIEGIVGIIKFAVAGLQDENIVITDQNGLRLNDFVGLEDVDRIEIARREIRTKKELEQQYKAEILKSLRVIFSFDRVEIVKLDIDLDMSKRTVSTEEHFPVTMKKDNPRTPFDETEVTPSITLSKEVTEEHFEGTGFNPEGPPGQEGQTPPAYKDLSNLVGKYDQSTLIQNEVVNKKSTYEEKSPWSIDRITTGVAIDGAWLRVYNENGQLELNPDGSIKREYTPVSDEDLSKAEALIKDSIGYDRDRGDSVTVEHISFDRSVQFAAEDEEFRLQRQLRTTIISVIIGIGAIIFAAILYRLIAKELERRRRLREEELARQHQAMREAALRSAEEEGAEVELSVEERARMEMQENAINMAREHPEDVAQLIRTWLLEE